MASGSTDTSPTPSTESDVPNIYAYRGRRLLSAFHDENNGIPHHTVAEMKTGLKEPASFLTLPVCIIGAGVTALYTAMIFESLDINYHIVDADTRERIGGRLFTYHFPRGNKYDYFDVGAMRFPDTPFMKRTFNLVKERNLDVKLIPYVLKANPPNTWLLYNNSRIKSGQDSSVSDDPFNVKDYVPTPALRTPQGVATRVASVLAPFRNLFTSNSIANAMDLLFDRTNKFSMRSYMFIQGMNPKDVSWCETINFSTGSYDKALTEIVIESLAFDWPLKPGEPAVKWYCIDGGSSTLPQAMWASLSKGAQDGASFNSPVTAITRDPKEEVMKISINGVQSKQEYSAVISTVPLPCLGIMDLTGVNINENYAQWSAIRELQYGQAVKVGIRFRVPWWETKLPLKIHGGQSHTDLSLRTVVYPSYPDTVKPEDRSRVLIASYCWTQDADRLGAFITGDGKARPELLDIVFRDLAAVHGVTVQWIKEFYTEGDYFAWDWTRDPLTMGAFAFFGPGVYGSKNIYNEMLKPAGHGKLFFAGEATSSCHAWVAGALDSAWRAVDQYLYLHRPKSDRDKFWDKWGRTEYWDESKNDELVKLNRELTDRQLVIALYEDGVRPGKEPST